MLKMFKLRLKQDWDSLQDYLNRRLFSSNSSERVVGDKVEEYAKMWTEKGEEIKKQELIILIERLEKGFGDKTYERGYREGLAEFPNVWSGCKGQITLNNKGDKTLERKQEEKEQQKEGKKRTIKIW